MNEQPPILLASSSVYRKQQLRSIGLAFDAISPSINESPQDNEAPEDLARRLAIEKAMKVKRQNLGATVIGSDQVCAFDGQIFGKPGSADTAQKQLLNFSNNTVEFFTALCVLKNEIEPLVYVDKTTVKFRSLSLEEIDRYIGIEQPLNCAGSFKVESLGLSLFESVESTDPSALMGLPLIKLCQFLRHSGYQIP